MANPEDNTSPAVEDPPPNDPQPLPPPNDPPPLPPTNDPLPPPPLPELASEVESASDGSTE